MAAIDLRQAGESQAMNPLRYIIRMRLAQAAGKSNEKILKEIKKIIPAAATVRVLRSGNTDVIIPDESIKNKTNGLPLTEDLKIYRKDYLVEILKVSLGVYIADKKEADNI